MYDPSSILTLALLIGVGIGSQYAVVVLRRKLKSKVEKNQPFADLIVSSLSWASVLISLIIWLTLTITGMQLFPQTQGFSQWVLHWGAQLPGQFRKFLFDPFRVGKSEISVFSIFQIVIFIIVVVFLARSARRTLLTKIFSQTTLDLGIQHTVATFTQYAVIAIGFLVGLQTAGIDLSALTILAGAVGVGVGLGLQNIANNFISGIIILFERPIKIGDRIEVGDVTGDVVHIAARSTTVRTNDNIAIIIPNSSFISSNVINWSHGDSKVRFRVPVGVAYGSDVRLVEQLLLEVAKENENVLEEPPARVAFISFGESALRFELRAWSSRMLHRRGVLISQLNFGIYEKFKQHQIEIPFPQRDLHLKVDPDTLRHLQAVNVGKDSSFTEVTLVKS